MTRRRAISIDIEKNALNPSKPHKAIDALGRLCVPRTPKPVEVTIAKEPKPVEVTIAKEPKPVEVAVKPVEVAVIKEQKPVLNVKEKKALKSNDSKSVNVKENKVK